MTTRAMIQPYAQGRHGAQHDASRVPRIRSGVAKNEVESSRVVTHARLDRRLEILARRPDRFAQDARRLGAAFDARGFDLEISDPSTWRGTTGASRVTVENQFDAEIEGVQTLERDEELRLVVRLEFARIRLDRALEGHGLVARDLAGAPNLPPLVRRRRLEWHALRLEMVERNLYLVLVNVQRYGRTSADRSDLIQAAAATLLRAVDGFDWRRGVLFRTYAVHWLNKGFRGHLYNFNSTVRVPVYLHQVQKHVNAAVRRLGDAHASVEDLARETGLHTSTIGLARTATRRTHSLDAPLGPNDRNRTLASGLTLLDDEGPYSASLDDSSIRSEVEAALGSLTHRERRAVELRFGIGGGDERTYSEVAREMGVSLDCVRQVLVRARSKMRTPRLLKRLEPLLV